MVLKMIKARASRAISEGKVQIEDRLRPYEEKTKSPVVASAISTVRNMDTV